jgi:putative inorganic carbon (HCO3(-)) transporter
VANVSGIQARRRPAALAGLEGSPGVAAVVIAAFGALVAAGAALEPLLTLIGLGALAVVALGVWQVEIAVLLFVATIPLETVFQTGGGLLTVTKVAGLFAFLCFLMHCVVTGRVLRFDETHALVFLLFVIGLLSSLQARELEEGLVTTLRYASFGLLFFVLSQLAGDRALQRRLVWVLSLAAAAAAALGLRNYLSGETVLATLANSNPNDFAFILATTLPLTLWLFPGASWLLRVAVVGMAGLMSAAVALSLSRGALVSIAAMGFVVLLGLRRRALIALGIVLVAAVATLAVVRADPERFETTLGLKQKVSQYNVSSRLGAWDAAAELAAAHPALGIGPGNFQHYYYEATGRPPGTENLFRVHNAYLDVATELGIPAFLLFGTFLLIVYSRSRACERGGFGPPGLAYAVRLSLVAALAGAVFLSEQYEAPIWVAGALATALWMNRPARAAPQPARRGLSST